MYTAILPWIMDLTILILTILCIEAGHKPGFMDGHPIITIDTLPLRLAYEAKYGNTSAIHDVYTIHMQTSCFGDYPLVAGDPLVNVACTPPSTYSKFEPFSKIKLDLAETKHNSTIDNIPFFAEARKDFHEKYDLFMHVAFVFYIMTAVWMGLGLLTGLTAFVVGALGFAVPAITGSASTFLLIASALVTAVQDQAVVAMNDIDTDIQSPQGTRFLTLTWTAFGLSCASQIVWVVGATLSRAAR